MNINKLNELRAVCMGLDRIPHDGINAVFHNKLIFGAAEHQGVP
jgi:hypothetical protein